MYETGCENDINMLYLHGKFFTLNIFFKFYFVHTTKNIWIAMITWWYTFFPFCSVQALILFRLNWRISLLTIDTYMPRQVYNPPTETGPRRKPQRITRSTVPQCMLLIGNDYPCGTRMNIIIQYAYKPKRM